MKYEYYLKSIDRRWKKELAKSSSEKVLVLFPYLTPRTASLVLEKTEGKWCEVYTRFDLENFASGSSSLKILKELLKSGFSLYDLPKLHAKMIIIGDDFASIGSQNLTLQGTKNKEATVVISEPKEVAKIKQQVSSWISERQEITKEMIEDAEKLLEHLKRDFKKFKNEAKGLNTKISDNQKERERQERERQERERQEREEREERERQERERQKREQQEREQQEREEREERERQERERQKREQQEREQQERDRQERKRKFKTAVYKSRLAKKVVNGKVIKKTDTNKPYYSFSVDKDSSLINWLQPYFPDLELKKAHRYLCINESNRNIGWASVMKTCITFVAPAVKNMEIQFGNYKYYLKFNWIWNIDARITDNLQIAITRQKIKNIKEFENIEKLTIDCWFTLTNLEWSKINHLGSNSFYLEWLKSWILENKYQFNTEILRLICEPFKYTRNRHDKNKIINFFGPEGVKYEISLGEINNNYVLIAK